MREFTQEEINNMTDEEIEKINNPIEKEKKIITIIGWVGMALVGLLGIAVFIGEAKFQHENKIKFNNWYALNKDKEIRITIIKKYTSENEYTAIAGGVGLDLPIAVGVGIGRVKTHKMYYLVDENYNDHLASIDVYNKVDSGVYVVNRHIVCENTREDSCYPIIDGVIKKIK